MVPTLQWLEDPTVFRVNRLDAHSDHICYPSKDEIPGGKSSLRQSLDGQWKFHWSDCPAHRPADFWKPEFSLDGFMEDMRDESKKIFPKTRNSGAIVINMDLLIEKKLPEPTCYEDLLKPEYKNLISMPNPKSSGTGYMFLKALVNSMGEDEAFAYFDKLSENVLQFTSSGSGPVNSLVSGEAVIGLGMTAQAVTQINEGVNLKIIYFEEGAPCSVYGYGIIKGKENRECVREVFNFFYETLILEDCELFFPEQIYKGVTFEIDNYPSNIVYADMSNNSIEEKERLLSKWMY